MHFSHWASCDWIPEENFMYQIRICEIFILEGQLEIKILAIEKLKSFVCNDGTNNKNSLENNNSYGNKK